MECKQCATKLTEELQWVEPSVRIDQIGTSMLQLGTITKEDGSLYLERTGVYMTNEDAGINMRLTEDSKRLNGCCGLDGCNGPNLLCEGCNTYVATKLTDCWRVHCIEFEVESTRTA